MFRSRRSNALLFAFGLACMTLLSVPTVAAKDMRGKLGIGANSTLTNARGLTVRYWPTRRLGVEVLAGASIARGSDQGDRIGVAFAAQLSYVLREIGRANLIIGIRGVLAYVNDDGFSQSPDTADSGPDISNSFLHPAVEAPLTIEYHFSDAFSLQLAVGLALSFVPEEGALLTGGRLFTSLHEAASDRNYETVLGIGSGGLFGSAGFTFYF